MVRAFQAGIAISLALLVSSRIAFAQADDQILPQLEQEMAEAYARELPLLDERYQGAFQEQQKAWLSSRAERCPGSDRACLIDLYAIRVNQLNALVALNGSWSETVAVNDEQRKVEFPKDGSEALEMLKQAHPENEPSVEVVACEPIINVPAYRANTYGGVCSSSGPAKLQACADDMVGNRYAEFTDRIPSTEELAQFVLAHCAGG